MAALAPMTNNHAFMKKQAAEIKKHKQEAECAAAGSAKLRIDNVGLTEEMKKLNDRGSGAKKGSKKGSKKGGDGQVPGGGPAQGIDGSSSDAAMEGMDNDGLYGA